MVGGAASYASQPGRQLRKGKHKVQLWPIKENDESLDYVAPGKISVHDDELWRIEKVCSS